jgi:hypothetical protein
MGECRRCYSDKNTPKRFSEENNMDPGDLPEELQGLTEIEEMLIAQIFPVISVYSYPPICVMHIIVLTRNFLIYTIICMMQIGGYVSPWRSICI